MTDARALAGQIGVAKAMRDHNLRRVISFHNRVKQAKGFADSLPDVIAWMPADERPAGRLYSTHVSGEMPTFTRREQLRHLKTLDKAPRCLVANARCLSEGIDVPALDGVAFIEPKRSEVDIVQAVGRAIRLDHAKKIGTIVIPVFIDPDADPSVALSNSAFDSAWNVLLALRAHDEVLAEQLDELRRQLGQLGKGVKLALPPKIHVDLPDTVGTAFARAFKTRLVEMTTASWEFRFGLLEQFVADNGYARVPQHYMVDGCRLGGWVSNQRTNYAKGTLEADRADRLQALRGWTWDTFASAWEEGFARLLDYVESNGHARPPPTGKSMATGSVIGCKHNAPCAPTASLVLTVNADSRSCAAGYGRSTLPSGRRVFADCWTMSSPTVRPAFRSTTGSMTTRWVPGLAFNVLATPRACWRPTA